MTLTDRDITAVLEALNRSLAGEPETDEEDVEGMGFAKEKLEREQTRRAEKAARREKFRRGSDQGGRSI